MRIEWNERSRIRRDTTAVVARVKRAKPAGYATAPAIQAVFETAIMGLQNPQAEEQSK